MSQKKKKQEKNSQKDISVSVKKWQGESGYVGKDKNWILKQHCYKKYSEELVKYTGISRVYVSDSIDSFVQELSMEENIPPAVFEEILNNLKPVYVDIAMQSYEDTPKEVLMKAYKNDKYFDFLVVNKKNLEELAAGKIKNRQKRVMPEVFPNILSAHIRPYVKPYSLIRTEYSYWKDDKLYRKQMK